MIGVVLAVALKEVIKLVNVFDVIQILLLIDAVRCFIVVLTVDWYLAFSKEIKIAVKTLADSLDAPILELSFLYTPIEIIIKTRC